MFTMFCKSKTFIQDKEMFWKGIQAKQDTQRRKKNNRVNSKDSGTDDNEEKKSFKVGSRSQNAAARKPRLGGSQNCEEQYLQHEERRRLTEKVLTKLKEVEC